MSRFIETIKVLDGKMYNIEFHNNRFNKTKKAFFNTKNAVDLSSYIDVPEKFKKGLVKCRVLYSREIEKVEFSLYEMRSIKSLKLVKDNDISYEYKFENREAINKLFLKRSDCDDIIIVKNDSLIESSYCNIAFFDGNSWLTPKDVLLRGTKRAQLLKDNKIIEKKIKINDLEYFEKVSLFNAMIDLNELIVPVCSIHS